MSITANFNIADFDEHRIQTSYTGTRNILRLGIYPRTFTLYPNGGPVVTTEAKYIDAYGVLFNTSEYQLQIQVQLAINMGNINVPTTDPDYGKIMNWNDSVDISYINSLVKKYWTGGSYTQYCAIPLDTDGFGFSDFTPINQVEYIDGLYTFEAPVFSEYSPYYIIGDERVSNVIYFDWNYSGKIQCVFNNTFVPSGSNIYAQPVIRKPFYMLRLNPGSRKMLHIEKYFIDIVKIGG